MRQLNRAAVAAGAPVQSRQHRAKQNPQRPAAPDVPQPLRLLPSNRRLLRRPYNQRPQPKDVQLNGLPVTANAMMVAQATLVSTRAICQPS